eukprot:32989-Chlamydomonas_euryale.AAC.1
MFKGGGQGVFEDTHNTLNCGAPPACCPHFQLPPAFPLPALSAFAVLSAASTDPSPPTLLLPGPSPFMCTPAQVRQPRVPHQEHAAAKQVQHARGGPAAVHARRSRRRGHVQLGVVA